MRILLENILIQYGNELNGKLVYIYSGKENAHRLYQDLIDSNILYYHDSTEKNINNIHLDDMVRLTSRNKEFGRFDKNIVHRRFAPTFKKSEHKYDHNQLFAYMHNGFVVINYEYLLRKKKIDKLFDITK